LALPQVMWQQLRWADLYFSIVKFSQDVAFQNY